MADFNTSIEHILRGKTNKNVANTNAKYYTNCSIDHITNTVHRAIKHIEVCSDTDRKALLNSRK